MHCRLPSHPFISASRQMAAVRLPFKSLSLRCPAASKLRRFSADPCRPHLCTSTPLLFYSDQFQLAFFLWLSQPIQRQSLQFPGNSALLTSSSPRLTALLFRFRYSVFDAVPRLMLSLLLHFYSVRFFTIPSQCFVGEAGAPLRISSSVASRHSSSFQTNFPFPELRH